MYEDNAPPVSPPLTTLVQDMAVTMLQLASTPQEQDLTETVLRRVVDSHIHSAQFIQTLTTLWPRQASDHTPPDYKALRSLLHDLAPKPKKPETKSGLEEKLVRELTQAWQTFSRIEIQYKQALGEAWMQALEQLIEVLRAGEQRVQSTKHPREIIELWTQIGDQVFKETFAEPDFINLHTQFISAAEHLKSLRQNLSDAILAAHNIPTQSDIMNAYKLIYELRKEVRQLKRQLEDQ